MPYQNIQLRGKRWRSRLVLRGKKLQRYESENMHKQKGKHHRMKRLLKNNINETKRNFKVTMQQGKSSETEHIFVYQSSNVREYLWKRNGTTWFAGNWVGLVAFNSILLSELLFYYNITACRSQASLFWLLQRAIKITSKVEKYHPEVHHHTKLGTSSYIWWWPLNEPWKEPEWSISVHN